MLWHFSSEVRQSSNWLLSFEICECALPVFLSFTYFFFCSEVLLVEVKSGLARIHVWVFGTFLLQDFPQSFRAAQESSHNGPKTHRKTKQSRFIIQTFIPFVHPFILQLWKHAHFQILYAVTINKTHTEDSASCSFCVVGVVDFIFKQFKRSEPINSDLIIHNDKMELFFLVFSSSVMHNIWNIISLLRRHLRQYHLYINIIRPDILK